MEVTAQAEFKDSLESITIESESDIVAARQRVRDLCRQLGFSTVDLTLVATAVSEIARNILEFAKRGTLRFGRTEDGAHRGILIIAEDQGPGIADIELALQNGYSTRKSLGMGLPGTKRLVDDFQIESALGKGTKVTLTKWNSNRPRQ